MKNKKALKRDSNIELLRLLTMLGVVLLHYNNASMGGGLRFAQGDKLHYLILIFFESICVISVNLFVLISGYFMCSSNKRDPWKSIQLIVQTIIYSEAIYFILIAKGDKTFSFNELVVNAIPNNYFVILYVVLFFISPFINVLTDYLSKQPKMFVTFMLLIGVLFSVYPTLVDLFTEVSHKEWNGLSSVGSYGSQYGYTIVHFVFMYIVGAFIRHCPEKLPKNGKAAVIFLVNVVMISGWALLNDKTGYGVARSAWEYCNPLVIINAALVFSIFRNIKLKPSAIINTLSAGSFSVYLMHTLFLPYIGIEKAVGSNIAVMLVHLLLSCAGIYLACWVVYFVYEKLTAPVYGFLAKHIKMPMLIVDDNLK